MSSSLPTRCVALGRRCRQGCVADGDVDGASTTPQDQISNPAPLGLLGFAITTALLQGAVNGSSGVETLTWATAFAIGYAA